MKLEISKRGGEKNNLSSTAWKL